MSFSAATAQQTYELQLDLEEGQTMDETMIVSTKVTQELPSGPMEIDTKVTTYTSYQVGKMENSEIVLGVQYNRFITSSESMGMSQTIDTDSLSENDPSAKILGRLTNKPFQAKLTPTGEVIAVDGLEKLWTENDTTLTPMERAGIEQLKSSFGGEAFRKAMERAINIFPDENVQIGDTWQTEEVAEVSGMTMEMKVTYTLTEVTDKHFILDIDGTVKSDPSKPMMQMGMEMTMDLQGTNKGTVKLDKETRWPVESEATQSLKGTVGTQAMDIPMEIVTTYLLNTVIE